MTRLGNAMVGAYLNELGLSEEAIVYITSAQIDALAHHPRRCNIRHRAGTLPTRNAQPPPSAASPAKLEESFEQRTANYPAGAILHHYMRAHLFCASTLRPLFCTTTTCARHGFGRAAWRTEIRLDDGEPAEGGRRRTLKAKHYRGWQTGSGGRKARLVGG